MPEVTPAQALQIARSRHQAGNLAEAEQIYRRILERDPDHPEALHLLGLLAHQKGRHDAAIELISRAAAQSPANATYHFNLGNVFAAMGKREQAAACYRQALLLNPRDGEACNNLANLLHAQGDLDQALVYYERALAVKPAHPQTHFNLGNIFQAKRMHDRALAAYQRALALRPDYPEAHNNLGVLLLENRKVDDAIASFQNALAVRSDYVEAQTNLGNAWRGKGRLDLAGDCYERSVALRPESGPAHANLGLIRESRRDFDGAIASYEKALSLTPGYAIGHNNLGNALKATGRLDDAIAHYRRALELDPTYAYAHSNLIYAMSFHPAYDARAVLEECRRWDEQHARPLAPSISPHLQNRAPNRRLRIGYVSPHFRQHPVGRFILPLLQHHDHAYFEIFCYSDVRFPDAVTRSLHDCADTWRETGGLAHDQLAQLIRADQIDILIDLTMHISDNRLLVFARKPAPVQIAYLAIASGTGLGTMDYRFTDPHIDPPGADSLYTERSIRLPDTYFCYRPGPDTPAARNDPPVKSAGFVTFGCLTNFCKVSIPTLQTWCRLLASIPGSRLLLHAPEGKHRQTIADLMEHHGITAADRLRFVGFSAEIEYHRLYNEIDIALDPFPYGGGTTFCDAMWMGVPVVSLIGEAGVSRMGLSLLSNVALAELAAYEKDSYIRIAADLAQDPARLHALRSSLRQRMQLSPLMDAERFARNVEAAFRAVWQHQS